MIKGDPWSDSCLPRPYPGHILDVLKWGHKRHFFEFFIFFFWMLSFNKSWKSLSVSQMATKVVPNVGIHVLDTSNPGWFVFRSIRTDFKIPEREVIFVKKWEKTKEILQIFCWPFHSNFKKMRWQCSEVVGVCKHAVLG